MDYLQVFLSMLVFNIPQIIVYVVGIILAVGRLQTEPQKARLALIAFVGFLLLVFLGAFSQLFIISSSVRDTVMSVENLSAIFGLITTSVSTGLWILLLIALFSKSQQREKFIYQEAD